MYKKLLLGLSIVILSLNSYILTYQSIVHFDIDSIVSIVVLLLLNFCIIKIVFDLLRDRLTRKSLLILVLFNFLLNGNTLIAIGFNAMDVTNAFLIKCWYLLMAVNVCLVVVSFIFKRQLPR